jgi:ATP-binding cassette subfamily B protein
VITLGGEDISLVDPETLLNRFSIVFQDVTLFNSSVMENIRLGKKGATDEEVMKAAQLAQCGEFIQKLPQGYGTLIGENGEKLSGGERQRISIARAILKDAPIILLDEATASLDAENESKIQMALSELIKNKTVLIIAHRMRTVLGADKIVVMKEGAVKETGSPIELRETGGIFSAMLKAQFQNN